MSGIQLKIQTDDTSLWCDDDKRDKSFSSIGLQLGIRWGKMCRKVPKFWRYKLGGHWGISPNPWRNPDDCWFELKLPFIIGPYISFHWKRFGFYCGLKVDDDSGLIPSMRITTNRRF